ncbi:hypothetical protein AB0C52_27435 [Streptomyces sp. NPDC048717]|uniref:hypothetical protein n=1 Tax=Streptomyces sp. NPDC048717 TaxID=3154928 RepID=UPI00341FA680
MPPPPPPAPPAPPSPSARPRPHVPAAVALPHYRRTARAKPKSSPNVVTTTLLITAPAVLATAILRPRSSR